MFRAVGKSCLTVDPKSGILLGLNDEVKQTPICGKALSEVVEGDDLGHGKGGSANMKSCLHSSAPEGPAGVPVWN